MSQNKEYLLIDHLDNNLASEETFAVEELIRNDKNVATEWQYLHVAVDAIQERGIYDQVSAIRNQYLAKQIADTTPRVAIVRNIYKNALRAAACVVLLLGAVSVYKYTTVNSASVYNKYYSSFELNTSRGSENTNELEQAYRSKNWQQVIALFNASNQKNNQSYFLAGMADLELKKYNEAVEAFKKIITLNAQSGDNYFQDDAEYYLAMGYLANNQANKAMPILEKIKADKNHLYNEKVREMSSIDLTIVEQKSSK